MAWVDAFDSKMGNFMPTADPSPPQQDKSRLPESQLYEELIAEVAHSKAVAKRARDLAAALFALWETTGVKFS